MVKALDTFRVRPALPPELAPLESLATNLRWAWDHEVRELFRWADPAAWEESRGNPVAVTGKLSAERIRELAGDAAFRARLAELAESLQRYLHDDRWAQSQRPRPPRIAYFSPEFGLSHVMQTYSGGLGVLAGDHLKAASDLGLDLVGIGLLYRAGYFRQQLDADGWQREIYPDLNPYSLPLQRLERNGEPAVTSVDLDGRGVELHVWLARVGRVPLLLLDSDVPTNDPRDRATTDKLYGGDVEHRLRQEIVLGIGGVRALRLAVGLGVVGGPAEVFHSNEGHAGFLQLERIRQFVRDEKLSFDEAWERARTACVFTTHTPVPAGIDRFPGPLFDRYFSAFAAGCGVSVEQLRKLGAEPQADDPSVFNMAMMALRLSQRANGVSVLHGAVSRRMFTDLWPGIEDPEVPITSVTNGVHAATWVGPEMRAVYDRHLAPGWGDNPDAFTGARTIGDEALWRAKGRARERLVAMVRQRTIEARSRRGESAASLRWAREIFDPDVLTIGFARRFAEYKRGTLLLSQPDRLRALLESADQPIQLVFAGKAHPHDDLGKGLIREIVRFSSDPELRTRMVFLADYDMQVAGAMLAGCDVWLNNPRRPHEACGTSGMKAVLNGALHASVLDGWWDEMYDGDNGFAIGPREHSEDTTQQDAADASALFELLEQTIVPLFYDRSEGPLPRRWLERVRTSITSLAPRVLATRMVIDYTRELYIPVGTRAARLAAEGGKAISELATWRARIADEWPAVEVVGVDLDRDDALLGSDREVQATVRLGRVGPDDVEVHLLHGPVTADGTLTVPRVTRLEPIDAGAETIFRGHIQLDIAGEHGIAVRVVPAHPDLDSWVETGLVTWGEPAQ